MRRHSSAASCLLAVLVAGIPIVEASGIVRLVARYCLRNVGATFTCYVFGRGGELIIDGSLTAAWNSALAAGKPPPEAEKDKKDGIGTAKALAETGKAADQPPPDTSKLVPGTPIIEPLGRRELGSLADRLAKQGQLKGAGKSASDGFLVYAPMLSEPDASAPKRDTGTGAPLSKDIQFHFPKSKGSGAMMPPGTTKLGRMTSASEEACRKERERVTGLGLSALFLADKATLETLNQRRLNEVILPCIGK